MSLDHGRDSFAAFAKTRFMRDLEENVLSSLGGIQGKLACAARLVFHGHAITAVVTASGRSPRSMDKRDVIEDRL